MTARATSKAIASIASAHALLFAGRPAGLPAPALASTREHHQEHREHQRKATGSKPRATGVASATSKPRAREVATATRPTSAKKKASKPRPAALAVAAGEPAGAAPPPGPLFEGLVALLVAHRGRVTDESRPLLDALESVAARAALHHVGGYPGHRLAATPLGPVAGLALASDDGEQTARDIERDPQLGRVVAELDRIVSYYDDPTLAGPLSPQADTVLGAVAECVNMAQRWASAPDGSRLELFGAGADGRQVRLCLVAPGGEPVQAAAPPQLSGAHRRMVGSMIDLFDQVSDARDHAAHLLPHLDMLRPNASALDREQAMRELHDVTADLTRTLFYVSSSACEVAAQLTGCAVNEPPTTHARALAAVDAASYPTTNDPAAVLHKAHDAINGNP